MNASVAELEAEVAASRQRLRSTLEELRSPEVRAQLKAEIVQSKDDMMRKASDATRSAAERMVQDVKARALANPAATLSIGAGIAWHLMRRPPIASVLIGLGVMGLMRTEPTGTMDNVGAQFGNQVKRAAGVAADTAKSWGGAAGETAKSWGTSAGETAKGWAAVASETAKDWSAVAGERAKVWSEVAGNTVQQQSDKLIGQSRMLMHDARDRVADIGKQVQSSETANALTQAADRALDKAQKLAADEAVRDQVLFGLAAMAVAAALGVAALRRSHQQEAMGQPH